MKINKFNVPKNRALQYKDRPKPIENLLNSLTDKIKDETHLEKAALFGSNMTQIEVTANEIKHNQIKWNKND
jgi:hypothetical protein